MSSMHFIISFILAYCLGSLPFGYWIGKLFYNQDILNAGSGNIGTTNTFRVLGNRAGLTVLVLDILKGTAGAYMAAIWGNVPSKEWLFFVGLGAIIGHTFSMWIKFRGGKAVATSAGVLLAYTPHLFVFASLVFITVILLSSMVSLGSMIGFTLVTLAAIIEQDWLLTIIAVALTIFVFYRHRENITRIKAGNESLVPFGLYYWSKHRQS